MAQGPELEDLGAEPREVREEDMRAAGRVSPQPHHCPWASGLVPPGRSEAGRARAGRTVYFGSIRAFLPGGCYFQSPGERAMVKLGNVAPEECVKPGPVGGRAAAG